MADKERTQAHSEASSGEETISLPPLKQTLHLWGFIKARSEGEARAIVDAIDIVARRGSTDWEVAMENDTSVLHAPDRHAFGVIFPACRAGGREIDEDVMFLSLSIYHRLAKKVKRSRDLRPIEALVAGMAQENPAGVCLWNIEEPPDFALKQRRVEPIAETMSAIVTALSLDPPWLEWVATPAERSFQRAPTDAPEFNAGEAFIEAGRPVRYGRQGYYRLDQLGKWDAREREKERELERSSTAPAM